MRTSIRLIEIFVRAVESGSFVGAARSLFIDPAEVGDQGIDVLVRPRGTRQRGSERRPQQGIVVRKLMESPILVCASPQYLERARTPRTPADLATHTCLALLTMERDVQDEWQ